MVQSLVLTANNIVTLNDDAVYARIQDQKEELAQALTNLHTSLRQLEQAMPNTGFEFGKATVENDILDYTRSLKAGEEELAELADFYLSGGLQDHHSLRRASHLEEVLHTIINNSYTICKIL